MWWRVNGSAQHSLQPTGWIGAIQQSVAVLSAIPVYDALPYSRQLNAKPLGGLAYSSWVSRTALLHTARELCSLSNSAGR
jgi:hypothetical protein